MSYQSMQNLYLYPVNEGENQREFLEEKIITKRDVSARINKMGCVNLRFPIGQYNEFEVCISEVVGYLRDGGVLKIIAHYPENDVNEVKQILEKKGIKIEPIDLDRIKSNIRKRQLIVKK